MNISNNYQNTDESSDNSENSNDNNNFDIQMVKVIIKKTDEKGNFLAGSHLQILDSEGHSVDSWITEEKVHETYLPDGTYTLNEISAPSGYGIAKDITFTVKVEIQELNSGADFSGTPLYYVEIKGEKYEVYCINQNWETPDENSIYDGEMLNSENIRDYTRQTVPVGIESGENGYKNAIMSDEPIDVSDQTLDDDDLYDKLISKEI